MRRGAGTRRVASGPVGRTDLGLDARRSGVGRALYGALLLELLALGYCRACAGITLPNAASVALHESMGFRPVGVFSAVGHKLGRWHDVGWCQRPLQQPDPPPPLRPYARAGGA